MIRIPVSGAAALLVLTATLLAGCGVDGPPERPAAPRTPAKSSISMSGHATTGVVTEL
ncbi:lipoprotein [Paracoccus salsus]|uniref:lipoprotein n=1 Tax=Paracoccus salsus TaxID=2911061 RepID=UPI001F434D40|nr:lipoprotein [Paracoccus salsus]MCF3973014.1 lipoprotein [Paracoccus salsus]